MPRRTGLSLLLAALLTASGLVTALPAQADQRLVEVTPGNGESVQAVPAEVVLTFAEPLDDATVEVTVLTPSAEEDADARVDGREVTVAVPDAGPGLYEIAYRVTPGQAEGRTGFTVLAEGETVPASVEPSPWWWLVALVVLAGLAFTVLRMLRLWRRR